MEIEKEKALDKRREALERRMKGYKIDYSITHLPYLDETQWTFIDSEKVGRRAIILYAVAVTGLQPERKNEIIDWLKSENLWEDVSENEEEFLSDENSSDETNADFSWRFEGAYILAWALNKIHNKPEPGEECDTDEVLAVFPKMGISTKGFLNKLGFRHKAEIFDENLFNELSTAFLRDLYLKGADNYTGLHPVATHERNKALNWVRQFGDTDDWDEVGTDT